MSTVLIVLISLCTFGTVTLIAIVLLRMQQIKAESKELNKRLKFWLSERSTSESGDIEQETREESFTKKVLIPLGEQVGRWAAEKIPYHKQSGVRKLLIRAGYREKKAFQFFYAIKIAFGIIFATCTLFFISTVGNDLLAGMALAFTLGAFGFIFPNFFLDNQATQRRQNIDRVLPDALDLLVICTEAGMGIDQSLLRVAANLGSKGKELAEEIILTNREMNLGVNRTECWTHLGERANSEELENLARIIIQAEKVGSSIGSVLRNQADFLRVRRRQKAEETAAKMTIKMMLPMAFFIFPCIMAVTMGPPVLKLVSTFSGLKQ